MDEFHYSTFYVQGLALFLLLYTKIKGVRSSAVQFLFWLLMVIFEIPGFRTAIREEQRNKGTELFPFVILVLYYPLLVAELLLQCWADVAPQYRENIQMSEVIMTCRNMAERRVSCKTLHNFTP